ncbi:MAG: DnaJ domain-containing protein [Leptolyngbyaceae bacterium]|nr:DnaJ domain-containing protein [Leptolyngbyaceae bacterium]
MAHPNHYKTLNIEPTATQAEVKQAYRRLVKLFHPDSRRETANHDQIAQINEAYEVLGDPHHRQSYDQSLTLSGWGVAPPSGTPQARQNRTVQVQKQYQAQRQTGQEADELLEQWLHQVYEPINRKLYRILNSLQEEIDQLSADPFDDELMEEFQAYLTESRSSLNLAQRTFRSMPNPANVAGAAAHLYHCLNQVGDGIDELERFTYNYSDHYLHTGQELFRIAKGLRREAQTALKHLV